MKALIVLWIIATLMAIVLHYRQKRDIKKLLTLLGTFIFILSMAVMSNFVRHILPLYIAHFILLLFSWVGLMLYLLRDRYYWWIIFTPLVTIALFLLLEFFTGSGHQSIMPETLF